ncbi:hypothetical protein ACIP5Y_09280 [Nocardia sp. NPDC088792]|uniref:MmyB family transcriptional regulator n=1 Tax=Nocardia sp. NPDC088792 TaxID=3364332 RepID=UPI0037FCF5D2
MIMNDHNDVLAWNPLAAAVIADFPNLPPRERNMARRIFLAPEARTIHPDWDEAARSTVGMLRMAVGRTPGDPRLLRLIGELTVGSSEFGRLWATRYVHEKSHGPKRFHHPVVGEIALRYETFHLAGPDAVLLVTYAPEPGSPAAAALEQLRKQARHE